MKKKIVLALFLAVTFFIGSVFVAKAIVAAPRLYFDPSTVNTTKNNDFQVTIKIDVENQNAFGAEALVKYPADLTFKSVSGGGFFEEFENAPSTGQVQLRGFFSDLDDTKSGSGNFAVLTFNTSRESGNANISMNCTANGNDTFILDENGENILSCTSLNQLTLNYGDSNNTNPGQGGNTTNSTNACGGTCGSHSNCNAGLFCSEGFCRNPVCPGDPTCACNPTPNPTIRAQSTVRPTVKPTPEVITLTVSTPFPTVVPAESLAEAESEEEIVTQKASSKKVALILGSLLLMLAIILYIIKRLKEKGPKPPTKPGTINLNLEEFKPTPPESTPYNSPPNSGL